MWDWFLHVLTWTGWALAHLGLWLGCGLAIALSCLSISGTWLIVLLALISLWLTGEPGWMFIGIGIAVSTAVELMEWGASIWGIRKRGGSGTAGWAALLGAILGMILGGFIPFPIFGSLLGMLVGSFVFAYLVERRRMEKSSAAHVAMGAVVARIFILITKILVTLVMTIGLIIQVYF